MDSSNEHTTTALYRAAIGPVNTEYYLKVFAKFETANRASAQWNWAAALSTINWMIFRKLWIPALAYTGCVLGVLLVVFGIGGLIFKFPDAVRIGLALLFAGAAIAMPGFYGTALFHNTCRKKMAFALTSTATLTEACTLLNRRASQRPRLMGIALTNLALLGILTGLIAGLRKPDTETSPPEPTAEQQDAPEARNIAVGRAIEDAPAPPAAAESDPLAQAPLPAENSEKAPLPAATTPEPLPAPLPAPLPVPLPATPISAPAATPSAQKAPSPAPLLPPLPTLPAAPTPKPVAKPVIKPIAAAPAPAKVEPAKTDKFLINVGLFADENNARNAKTKLVDAGLSAFTEEAIYPKGKRIRVRVGPFETQTEADAAAEKIRNLGLEAAVFKQ